MESNLTENRKHFFKLHKIIAWLFNFNKNEHGFSYLAALFAVTIIGITLGITGQVWSTAAKREKEAELLFRGLEIQKAIGMYYESSTNNIKSYPPSLDALVKDPRSNITRRFLRRIYDDPFTGKPDWETIKAPNGGIKGVKSTSSDEPIKKNMFSKALKGFEDRTSYSDWQFVYTPSQSRNQ